MIHNTGMMHMDRSSSGISANNNHHTMSHSIEEKKEECEDNNYNNNEYGHTNKNKKKTLNLPSQINIKPHYEHKYSTKNHKNNK